MGMGSKSWAVIFGALKKEGESDDVVNYVITFQLPSGSYNREGLRRAPCCAAASTGRTLSWLC